MNRNIPIGPYGCMVSSNDALTSSSSKKDSYWQHHQRLRLNSVGLFPTKLHDMIDYAELQGMTDIVSWTNDGLAFNIHSQEGLGLLLPQFFGQTKVRSFQRQLHLWSFEKLREGINRGAMAHPFFIRGRKEIIQNVSRESFKRSAARGKTTCGNDPDSNRQPIKLSSLSKTTQNDGNSSCTSSSDEDEFIPNFKKTTAVDVTVKSTTSSPSKPTMLDPLSFTALNKICGGPLSSMYCDMNTSCDSASCSKNVMMTTAITSCSKTILSTSTQGSSSMSSTEALGLLEMQQQQQQWQQNKKFHEGELVDFEGKQFFFLDLDIPFF